MVLHRDERRELVVDGVVCAVTSKYESQVIGIFRLLCIAATGNPRKRLTKAISEKGRYTLPSPARTHPNVAHVTCLYDIVEGLHLQGY